MPESGLKGPTRNRMSRPKRDPGFESQSLRHLFIVDNVRILLPFISGVFETLSLEGLRKITQTKFQVKQQDNY